MRRVFAQPRGADRGPAEKHLRRWLDKDPKGFVARLAALERAEQKGGPAADPAGPAPDEGEERLDALIDRLLAEFEQEEVRRLGAGRCPTCGRPAAAGPAPGIHREGCGSGSQ